MVGALDTMRFLHTADWHLGRTLNGVDLIDDQAFALEQLLAYAADARLDAVVVAGDIFDRGVPPPAAVTLFDDTVHRLVVDLGLPTIAIAGNHDDPVRLAAHARLLRDRGLHIVGPPANPVERVTFDGADGRLCFHALPFLDPPHARAAFGLPATTHAEAMVAALQHADRSDADARHVAVAHAFVAGGAESSSERLVNVVGEAGLVPAERFDGFDYVALGHLHRPQRVGERARYSGSLLKYSLGEAGDAKGFGIVELSESGVTYEQVPIHPRRDVREVRATLDELLAMLPSDDYVYVALLDAAPVLNAMAKVRTVFPNALQVRRDPPQRRAPTLSRAPKDAAAEPREAPPPDVRRKTDIELFAEFVREAADAELTPAQRAAFAEVAQQARGKEIR